MHGGVKFYRGSAKAARSYVEADRSRVDDYYLAEGTGVAARYVATASEVGRTLVRERETLDGPAYERWVAGYDVSGAPKGRLRDDDRALRFVEVVVNGPKTWSLVAALHPEIAAAYDAALDRAAKEIVGWLAEHATTRVGPRGRQVQVPVEELEAAVVRHYTSRAGDPHRHLHLQINARVFAAGKWRGLHSVGVVDSIEAVNGIGHAAVMCDPGFRTALTTHGYTLADDGEVRELTPYAGAFSQRAAQIGRHLDRYEAEWRSEHPGQEPGPSLRRSWDRRAWADARPDKVVPRDGAELVDRWNRELHDLGFRAPIQPTRCPDLSIGSLDRDEAVALILSRLGARRSAWNSADIRGEAEKLVAACGVVAAGRVRTELAEDLTDRAVRSCRSLLERADVPEHVRSLTSTEVLDVEAELQGRLAVRAERPGTTARVRNHPDLDEAQGRVVAAIGGGADLLVVEGAAGAGKTTTLAAAREHVEAGASHRMVVVTPTLKAAQAAGRQVGSAAFSAAWFIHQHGFRWEEDGRWTRVDATPDRMARLFTGDVLLVDEAGMLDQDTARALLTIADEAKARVVLVGDRHQLPAVGRGGVLDLALRWVKPEAHLELESVHRFADPVYAQLSLLMRSGQASEDVFDSLLDRGQIVVHPSEVERTAALAAIGSSTDDLVVADTHDQVSTLNAAIHEQRAVPSGLVTKRGEAIGLGDRVATRQNARDLGVANRDTWTVAGMGEDGSVLVSGRSGQRQLPAAYVREHLELAYATTVHGAQGDTVNAAHLVIGESTGAAAAYVGMTRGRHSNVAHLVAESVDDARRQWVEVFARDRADLGPTHAAGLAAEDIERYGPMASSECFVPRPADVRRPAEALVSLPSGGRGPGVSR